MMDNIEVGGFHPVNYMRDSQVIFLASFAICYVLHTPEQGLARTFGLAFFAVVTGIANEQNYSFLSVANAALMYAFILLIMQVVTSIRVFVGTGDSSSTPATESN